MQQRRNGETVHFRATVFAGICHKTVQNFRLSSYWKKCNRQYTVLIIWIQYETHVIKLGIYCGALFMRELRFSQRGE
jgi:hypothetical protein